VRDHVHIGEGAVIGAMAGITNDVAPGSRMYGIPAAPEREQKARLAAVARLPDMRRKLNALEKLVHQVHGAPPKPQISDDSAAA
jgi:UDP-3-O-[3-hydroxymyristoyl] glucosamine N-acyltransferase